MTVTIDARFKLRGALAADAASGNPVPLDREMWVETDQGLADGKYKLKIGDGSTHYNDLPYISLGGGVESIVPGSHVSVDSADPKNPVVSVSGLAGSGYGEGSTFPASPSLDDKFYRTDINQLCYYDGTRWLTCTEYCSAFFPSTLMPYTAASGQGGYAPVRSDHQLYITRFAYACTTTGAASTVNYWDFGLLLRGGANDGLAVPGSAVDAKLWSNNFESFDVDVNYAVPSGTSTIAYSYVKRGSPGSLFFSAQFFYRLIVM